MCIYLFCNFSDDFNCKGNVKSMYSDYASGIAFLNKKKLFKQMSHQAVLNNAEDCVIVQGPRRICDIIHPVEGDSSYLIWAQEKLTIAQ